MKRILTSLIALLVFINLHAQTPHPWELGLNAGASWLQSDVKMKKLGAGLGFTFGQMYYQNKTSPIDWGWRFRYLNATTYGQDSKRSYGIANNNLFNGKIDTTTDYYHNDGFVYQNYRTHIDELSFEIVIGANRLRERTHVYPYIFGGAGITKAVAKTDQLNANNNRYNYIGVDSLGTASAADITANLNSLYDGDYESPADGNRSPSWKFMPSIGVGLGFEIVKGFSIGLEHKVTFALNDVLDGQQWTATNVATGNNDRYHYSSIWLKFSFGRSAKSSTTTTGGNTDANNYTNNTNTGGNTTTNVNTNTGNGNTTGGGSNLPATTESPKIVFTNPASSGTTVTAPAYTVNATVTNVNSISDILFNVNGSNVSNYTYNSSTQQFSAPVTLVSGNNTFSITAANSAGTANAVSVVNLKAPPAVNPPLVTIANPSQSSSTTTVSTATVNGAVQNITAKEQMQITVNGAATNAFTYNPVTRVFTITSNLVMGANTFVVSASNPGGSDSKSVVIIRQQEVSVYTTPAPVVTITNPTTNPFSTSVNTAAVNATVQNVSSQAQISVTANGSVIPFMYNVSSHMVNMTVNLVTGANTVTVSATTPAGSASQTQTIIYAPVVNVKPVVTILNPSVNPYHTSMSATSVNATVMNVNTVGQIAVTVNGSLLPASALSFNGATHQLSFNTNLINGANAVQISASNTAGSDSKSVTLIYEMQPAPVITITTPSTNPYSSSVNATPVLATVLNVTAASQVAVKLNGANVPFTFNSAAQQVSFTAALVYGSNTVNISATNAVGSDSKMISILFAPVAPLAPPVITVVTPAASPFTSLVNTSLITAAITNVTSSGQVSLTLNGTPAAFSFNPSTHMLDFNASLSPGANTVVINAGNAAGSDSKSIVLIYSQPEVVPAPVIMITSPANPYSTTVNNVNITATIMNISSAGQIAATLNGGPFTAFSFDSGTHQFAAHVNLVNGANSFVIAASNASGSDTKTETVIFTMPAPMPPPVVTLTSPNVNPMLTDQANYLVKANILNVSSAGQIQFFLNNASQSGFTFNPTSHQLTFNATLHPGANWIKIRATNTAGSDSASATIKFTQTNIGVHPDSVRSNPGGGVRGGGTHGDAGAIGGTGGAPAATTGPAITWINPATTPFNTTDASYTVTASVDVMNASNITVKINGVSTTAFTFSRATHELSIPVALNMGYNTIKVEATNGTANTVKTVVVVRH